MNRPLQPEQQCPSCHLRSTGPICSGNRRRVNQDEKQEYFKTIDCPLWVERRIEILPTGEKKCPMCGQVIISPVQPIIINAINPLDMKPGAIGMKPDTAVLDWGDSVLEQKGVSALQERVNNEMNHVLENTTLTQGPAVTVQAPLHRARRRDFKDMPPTKHMPKRKKEESTNV